MRFTFVLMLSVLIGCSSQKEISKDADSAKNISDDDAKKAMEFFINGSAAEAKGDYAGAILEYQDALKYDKSAGIYYVLAKNYFFLNKLPAAVQNSRKSVQLESDNIEYLNLLQEIYSSGKQTDSAVVMLEKILAIDSSQVNAYYKLARIYEINKPKQAIALYNRLTKVIGSDWNVLIRVAELYERIGDMDNSIKTVEELTQLDASNVSLLKLLVDSYIKKSYFDKAHSTLDDIIELYPEDDEAIEKKAQVYLMQSNWQSAASIYSEIFNKPGTNLEAKIRIGSAYFVESFKDTTLLQTSKDLFLQIDKDTTDWQVKMYLGGIAMRENQDSNAIKYFNFAVELAPWNFEAWLRLGNIYYENKDYNNAVEVFLHSVEKFAEEFAINFMLGVSYIQLNKYLESEPYLAKAVALNPQDVFALSAYGHTLNQLKKSDQAIEYLKKALRIEPQNVDLHGSLGLIFDTLEKWEECDSIYSAALKLEANNPLVNNNYSYSLSKRGVRLGEALNMINISLQLEPSNSSYLDTKGWVYYKMGQYDSAKVYIERSLEISGDKAVVIDHLGDVYFKLGNNEKAIELWNNAFKLDSKNDILKTKIEKGKL